MNKEDIISSGLLEFYVMGLSSPEEATQVENWTNEYPEVKQELNSIELSLESYAQSYAMEPSFSVKDKIFKTITQGQNNGQGSSLSPDLIKSAAIDLSTTKPATFESKVYRIPAFFKITAAAMLVLLIGSIVLNYSYYNRYNDATNNLQVAQNNLQNAQQKILQNQQANLTLKDEINVIGDKHSLPVVLNGTPHSPDALAKIYWVKTSGYVYVDPTNLPDVPLGEQYQLWAIVDGKPVDAGVISTDKGIYHIQKMKSFGHAEAFAITLEKNGGSKTPSMNKMFVISKI